jgi:hypothetical protein
MIAVLIAVFDALIGFRIIWQSSKTQFGFVRSAEKVIPCQTAIQDDDLDDDHGKQSKLLAKGSQVGSVIQENSNGFRELIEKHSDKVTIQFRFRYHPITIHFDTRFGVVCLLIKRKMT